MTQKRNPFFHLVTVPQGWYYTEHGGFTADHSRALSAEYSYLRCQQLKLNLPTKIIQAS